MNRLIAFYLGSHPDDRGRMLAEILRQDDDWLELTHDYIQWLFPLDVPSGVNPGAPLIDRATADAFKSDELLRRHLMASYQRFLGFLGLSRQADGTVLRSDRFESRKGEWFTAPTHNSLRITRILKCLSLLGLADEAGAFERSLQTMCDTDPDAGVGELSRRHWREAVATPARPGRPRR